VGDLDLPGAAGQPGHLGQGIGDEARRAVGEGQVQGRELGGQGEALSVQGAPQLDLRAARLHRGLALEGGTGREGEARALALHPLVSMCGEAGAQGAELHAEWLEARGALYLLYIEPIV